jgi:RNA polymerase sigma-70 factor, ECF subfamily
MEHARTENEPIINRRETFARLYDEFMPKIYRYVHYKVYDVALTEDLTSSVFEKALVNFDRYSSDKANFSTWLFSIAHNVVIDHYRAEGKNKNVPLDEAIELPVEAVFPEEEAENKAEKQCLADCLSKLSQEEQELIQLKFAGEFNNRQIARMTGLSEANVGTKLFRTIRKLKDNFRESWDG